MNAATAISELSVSASDRFTMSQVASSNLISTFDSSTMHLAMWDIFDLNRYGHFSVERTMPVTVAHRIDVIL